MQANNKTVVKSMQILTLFIKHPKLTFTEMMEYSGVPKTSLHRMVGSLEELGFLFLQFGQLVANRLDIRNIAKPVMEALRDEVEEAVNLIVRDGNEAMYIEKVDTLHPVRLYTSIGRRSPLYAGACSRIILAHLPEKEQEEYITQTELAPIGIGTITDQKKLRNVLKEAKEKGYTISTSELENFTTSVSAPIVNHQNEVVAGISVAGIEARFQGDRLPFIIQKVTEAASIITEKLGYQGSLK